MVVENLIFFYFEYLVQIGSLNSQMPGFRPYFVADNLVLDYLFLMYNI